MWTYISTNEFYHYGIPGMKWGKRKAKSVNNTSIISEKKIALKKAKENLITARIKKNAAYAAYSKTFDKATRISNQFGIKNRLYNEQLTETASNSHKADKAYSSAKKQYKLAKKAYKNVKKADTSKGNKAAGVALGVIGATSVAAIAGTVAWRRVATNMTILGAFGKR